MEKEGYSDKSLDTILSPSELGGLFDLMEHPNWYLVEKVNKAVSEDWLDQIVAIDLPSKTDKEAMNILRDRRGMIKGVTLFLRYLRVKKNKKSQDVV